MSALADFLLARIAEDEARAEYVHDYGSWSSTDHYTPARVLAECEAKRRIVDLHAPIEGAVWPTCSCCGMYGEADVDWPCATLRALALPYADHDDYREEFKP